MCWKADKSVRAFRHLHSSFPGTAGAQLGTLLNLCSFHSLGLILLFYCRSSVMFNTNFFKIRASNWISLWEDRSWPFVGLKAQPWQQSRPTLQGSKGMVAKRPVPRLVSLYTRCFATSALFHVSLLAAFLLLYNTALLRALL